MRYLTRSYVEALGLREVAGHRYEDPKDTWTSDEDVVTFIPGVVYGERFYRRSDDGLSYDLPTAPAFIR